MRLQPFGPWTSARVCSGRNDSESELIARGRRTSLATIVLATLLAPLLLAWDQGVFNFVLELSAIIGPPAAVVFVVGFFWSGAHGRSAVATLICGCLVAAGLWFIVAQGEAVPDWLRPAATRAGVTGLASLVLLGLFTFVIPASGDEMYDPNAAWNTDFLSLPLHDRDAGAGLGNIWIWWGLLLAASVALWIVLR